ncbi:MAG: NYN domain-containing protein, partial [Coriobacteriia bacterium]|nr:NYN domain-containing protein [Coriobacteriia bacterium]
LAAAAEPPRSRAMFFFDCQNLYGAARRAWGYRYACFDPIALSQSIAESRGWHLAHVHVYTGVPRPEDRFALNKYWTGKLRWVGQQPIGSSHSRPLRYRDTEDSVCPVCAESLAIVCAKCGHAVKELGHEKGIDTHLALDVVRMAQDGAYDVAVIVSQDQDFAPAAFEVNNIAKAQGRMIFVYSAYPENSHPAANQFPVEFTRRIVVTHDVYAACLDLRTYGTNLDVASIAKG